MEMSLEDRKNGDFCGTFPNYVSFSNCFYRDENWFGSKSGDYSSDGMKKISLSEEGWIDGLGDAFVLGDDGSEIPKLVWESRVNM